jgi:anti-sigma-K factor RskA
LFSSGTRDYFFLNSSAGILVFIPTTGRDNLVVAGFDRKKKIWRTITADVVVVIVVAAAVRLDRFHCEEARM